jgi:filamentous hemagglutinin
MRPLPFAVALAVIALGQPGNARSQTPGTSYLPGTVVGSQVWQGASVPNFQPGSNTLEILQTQSRASLYWNRFNVDVGQTVRFNQQGNRDWIALNWIADQNPTQIAGRLVADGQIYLINQNGIVFKPGSQVDASSFIASTLQINSEAFLRSLVALRDGRAAFTAFPGATSGRIELQQGVITNLAGNVVPGPNGQPLSGVATITSAEGGRVFLLAAQEVVNAGKIQSNGGQVVLAAGTSVYLFAPSANDDASFRGLFVEVNSGGSARNIGSILTERGNTSLVGLAVNNSGRITADSAVGGNGSVWLLSRSNLPNTFNLSAGVPLASTTGEVVLGSNSLIETRPRETVIGGQTQTLLDSQTVFPGQVRIEGRAIHLQGNGASGAQIVAPSGDVSLRAISNPQNAAGPSRLADPANSAEPNGPSRILIDANASIDVSGVRNVSVSVTRNVIPITLLGDVVADAPLIRNSPLAGATVNVDIRTGTPLLSRSSLDAQVAAGVRRGLLERSAAGGTLRLYSEGDAVLMPGSSLSFGGGSVDYTSGRLPTSRLFDGRSVFDIASAPADRSYQAADTIQSVDPRWGAVSTIDLRGPGRFDPGYTEGKAGGWLDINARWVSLGSQLSAQTVTGFYQRTAPADYSRLSIGDRNSYAAPSANSLPEFRLQQQVRLDDVASTQAIPGLSLTDPRQFLFGSNLDTPLVLSPNSLTQSGVGRLEVLTDREIVIPAGQTVRLPAGGRLTLGASTIDMAGSISVPSARRGNVNDTTVSEGIDLAAFQGAANLGSNASISARGQWTVEQAPATPIGSVQSAMRDGGSIRVRSVSGLNLASGSTIAADAGATMSSSGVLTGGNGGAISLQLLDGGQVSQPAAGTLNFGATLTGYGFGTGAAFTLVAPSLILSSAPMGGADANLTPEFFVSKGFSSFDLTGTESVRITSGTSIQLQQSSFTLQAASTSSRSVIRTSDDLQAAVSVVTRPDVSRSPVSLVVRAPSRFRGQFTMEQGSAINADARGSVRFDAGYTMDVRGSINSPGGTFVANLGRTDTYNGFRQDQNLFFGPGASVNVSGTPLTFATNRGVLTNAVLDGGTIQLNANEGQLLLDPAARLLARGITGVFDYAPNPQSANPSIQNGLELYSNGGQITLRALNGGLLAGTVDVSAQNNAAKQGDITIQGLSRRDINTSPVPLNSGPVPNTEQNIEIRRLAASEFNGGIATVLGAQNTLAVDPSLLSGHRVGRLSLDTADSVVLQQGGVLAADRSIAIDAQSIRLVPGVSSQINAPFVNVGSTRLGLNFGAPAPMATGGSGSLTINAAGALDLTGALTIQGSGNTHFNTQGPLRLQGTFNLLNATSATRFEGNLRFADNLLINATQIYPNSYTSYAITGLGNTSRLVLGPGNPDSAIPLSAAGSLSVSAGTIDVSGVIRAPLGGIALNATGATTLRNGAVLSVSAVDNAGGEAVIPFGSTQDRRAILYAPSPSQSAFIESLPKRITVDGNSVEVASGATIDARGGGDIQAYSFVSRGGVGNAGDILTRSNVFALVPGSQTVAPLDPEAQRSMLETRGEIAGTSGSSTFRGAMPSGISVASTSSLKVGDQVELGDSSGLPAGRYTLMPARYALLPGAFAIAATSSTTDAIVATPLADGSSLVPGRLVTQGTTESPAFQRYFNVLPQAVVTRYSDYILDSGNRSFAATAQANGSTSPRLPADAGQVGVSVTGTQLDLSGQIALQGRGAARAGELAVSAANLYIDGGSGSAPANSTTLTSARLVSINPETLIVGGRSAFNAVTQQNDVNAQANSVTVGENAILANRSVILAATSQITVRDGAQIGASTRSNNPAETVNLRGAGAFIATSESTTTTFASPTGANSGSVTLGAQVSIDAGSVALVAPTSLNANGNYALRSNALVLTSNALLLGDGASNTPGARIRAADLASLSNADRLRLNGVNTIVLTDNVLLGGSNTQQISLDTGVIAGSGSSVSTITAQSVEFLNSGGAIAGSPALGNATLNVRAISVNDNSGRPKAGSGQIRLGAGSQAWSGFGAINLATSGPSGVAGELRVDSNTAINSSGNVTLDVGRLATSAGVSGSIHAAGRLSARPQAGTFGHLPTPGLGGRINLTAGDIDFDSLVRLPSGLFSLTATTGSITAGASASIDLSGTRNSIATSGQVDTPGGQATLRADQGNIALNSGSTINVGGSGNQSAGAIELRAGIGLTANGSLLARPSNTSGASALNEGRLTVQAGTINNAQDILGTASANGFQRELSLRQTQGSLVLSPAANASNVRAHAINITADQGRVELSGIQLSALASAQSVPGVAPPAGQVNINAGQNIVLGPAVTIDNGQQSGPGASVLLNARTGIALNGTNTGPISIDLRGSAGASDGQLEYRFPRTLSANALASTNATVTGGQVMATSVDTFTGITEVRNTGTSTGSILSLGAASGPLARASAYMSSGAGSGGHIASSVLSALTPLTSSLSTRPEIEVIGVDLPANPSPGSTVGDVLVSQNLDFSQVRYGTQAGVLTIRAPRNLIVAGAASGTLAGPEAAINDGFTTGSGVTRSTASNSPYNTATPNHWSYNLVAGADPLAPSPLATRQGDGRLAAAGDFRLLNNRQIRTGTGDIQIRAAGDIAIGTQTAIDNTLDASGAASIVTAGRIDTSAIGAFVLPSTAGLPTAQQIDLNPRYTRDGGDISLISGRSISSVESGNLVSSWLFRWGQINQTTDTFVTNRQVSWWARPDLFRQTVGALGGGNVTLSAGTNIENVSASIASSGRLTGTNPSTGLLVETGGGFLDVSAGTASSTGSILSGSFNVMRGGASINAADALGSSRTEGGAAVFPLISLGDAAAKVTTRGDAIIDQIYNPTLAPGRTGATTTPRAINNFAQISQISTFSTYTDRSAVNVMSIGGSVGVVSTEPSLLFTAAGLLDPNSQYQGRELPFKAYPGQVRLYAPSGDVEIRNNRLEINQGAVVSGSQLYTIPSAQGQVDIQAGRDVFGSSVIYQGDFDIGSQFSVRTPARSLVGLSDWATNFSPSTATRSSVPSLQADPVASRFIAGRDIYSSASNSQLLEINLAEHAQIEAGRDVRNLALTAQNIRRDDETTVTAGRDVRNDVAYTNQNRLRANFAGITLNGPGQLVVRSGRDIALGTSQGVVTRGNATNPALLADGASITLVAGLSEDADYAAFLNAYVNPSSNASRPSSYDQALIDFVRQELGGNAPAGLTAAQAWATLGTLPVHRQNTLARNVFFSEVRAGGVGFGNASSADFRTAERAYAAARILFPKDGAGNIDVIFSQVKTEQGGGIEVITPGTVCRTTASACSPDQFSTTVGNVVAGLTSPPPDLTTLKTPNSLGFLTLNGGDMNFYTGRDIAINQSRALTAGGGSITMFSALGNIDAGRGSRSAVSAPPPQVRVDANGNIVVELPGAVQGSGIGVLVTRSDVPVGDVFLFAPKGFLDAGEAGVRSSGNVVVAATEVRNAANISFGGASSGVPVSTPSVNIGGLSAASTGSSGSQAANAAAQSSTDGATSRSARRVLLVLEFLGFADEGEEAYRRRRGR